MHTLFQLSDKDTKELRRHSIPIIHFHDTFSSKVIFKIMNFLQFNDESEGQTFAKKREVLSGLLGFEPNHQKRFDFLTAVWGLSLNDVNFTLYYSHKGLSIEFDINSNKKEVNDVLDCLEKILIDKKEATIY